MHDLKQMAALTALNDMMQRGHMSICTIDKIGSMMGIKASGEDYQLLSTLHCVDFAKMPPELRDAIPGLIQKVLGVAPAYQFKTMPREMVDVVPQRRGFLQILGGK